MADFEIFTTGGGFHLYNIFNYLAAFTSSGNFQVFLTIGITIGVFFAAFKLVFGGSPQELLFYVIAVAIIGGIGVGPRARVIIMDSTQPIPIYGVVDNVPFSVAMVGHYTSAASYYLTGQMEALLAAPDDLAYQKSGMLFGASLLSQASRWRAVTPILHENLVNFAENCIIDGVNIGIVDLEEAASSGTLTEFINSNVPASLAYYDVIAGETKACRAGWQDIRPMLTEEVNKVLATRASGIFHAFGGAAANNTSLKVNKLKGTLTDFQDMMGLASANSVATIKQSMLILALDDATGRLIANSGNNAAMQLYQAARADAQTRSSYAAIGANANKWVPLLKITFETLYYAAFPLAMMLMMTPLALTVMKGYFGGFLWLASWEPLSAILHSIMLQASGGWYREAAAVSTGGGTEYILTWANHFGIQAVEQDVGAVAGYLMMSVPFLSFAIMFGASRMAGMATSLLNVSQGAAIDTGREAATGSLSLGNTSMNNMMANKWNTSGVHDAGRFTSVMPDGAMTTSNQDGSRVFSTGSAQSSSGFSAHLGQNIREEVSDRRESAERRVETESQELAEYYSGAASAFADTAKSVSSSESVSSDQGVTMSEESRSQVSEAWGEVQEFAEKHGLSSEVAMAAVLAGEAGVGKIGAAKLGANLAASGRLGAASTEDFVDAVRASKSENLTESVATIRSATESLRSGNSDSSSETGNEGNRWSQEEGERRSRSFRSAVEASESLSHVDAELQSRGVNYGSQMTDTVISELRGQGMSEADISSIINPKSLEGIQKQEAVIDTILPSVIEKLGIGKGLESEGFNMMENPEYYKPVDGSVPGTADTSDLELRQEHADGLYSANADGLLADHSEATSGKKETIAAAEKSVHSEQDKLLPEHLAERAVGVVTETADRVSGDSVRGASRASDATVSPQVNTEPSKIEVAPASAPALTAYERDVMTRTVLGEAAGESDAGMAAVAHVIKNRAEDPRWGDDPAEAALGWQQFSAWNAGVGGNDLVYSYNQGDPAYAQAAAIVDQVFAGQIEDPTSGATHYYSPNGMRDLVENGHQTSEVPKWLESEQLARGTPDIVIGGHVFTGRKR